MNQGPKELREELERTRTERDTIKKSITDYETKIKEYESRGLDTKALTERLEAREKEFEALQGELRALKQEASPEFKKQWDEPFERTANYTKRLVTGLTKEDGTQGSYDDFVAIYRMPYNAAAKQARETFGEDGAPAVMDQYRKLHEMEYARNEAFEAEKKSWKEKAQQETAKQAMQREQAKTLREKVRKELTDTVEEYRDPVDDKELAEARQQGYAIVDAQPQTYTEAMTKLEHMRHQAAAFHPMKVTIVRLKKEVDELKAQLAKHKPRTPGDNTPAKPGGDASLESEPQDPLDYYRKAVNA